LNVDELEVVDVFAATDVADDKRVATGTEQVRIKRGNERAKTPVQRRTGETSIEPAAVDANLMRTLDAFNQHFDGGALHRVGELLSGEREGRAESLPFALTLKLAVDPSFETVVA
jgi:hypothetical protein